MKHEVTGCHSGPFADMAHQVRENRSERAAADWCREQEAVEALRPLSQDLKALVARVQKIPGCRQCGKKGDTIQYLRDFRGLSFREAARLVGKQLGSYQPRPATNTLWRYLEEQYEGLREDLTMVQWASLAISKHADWYS
ncbi:MAG: hypothetical protein HY268_22520 [Deltaproteobacteria bacterium]|nr:hypothetical protein [Deltaproteobacteria bacterium]